MHTIVSQITKQVLTKIVSASTIAMCSGEGWIVSSFPVTMGRCMLTVPGMVRLVGSHWAHIGHLRLLLHLLVPQDDKVLCHLAYCGMKTITVTKYPAIIMLRGFA